MVQSRFFLGLMISHVYGVPRRWAHLRQTGCKLLPNRFRCSPFVKNRSQTYVPFAMTTLGALFSLHKYQVTRLNLVSRFSSREINGDRNLSNRDEKERKKERKKEDERKLFKFFNESVPCGRLGWSAPISPRRFSCALRFGIFLHLLLLLLFKLNKLPRPSDVITVTFDRPDSTRTDVMEWKPA